MNLSHPSLHHHSINHPGQYGPLSTKLQPLLKWAGGKEKELKYIIPNLPAHFENYYEPFVGGGAVYTTIQAQKYFINDRSRELIYFYKCIIDRNREDFFTTLDEMTYSWSILARFIQNNIFFFSKTYRAYVEDQITYEKLQAMINEFAIDHTHDLYAMFPATLQCNMWNFIKEVQVNFVRKIKRMKAIETKEQQALSDIHIVDNIVTALKSAFYMHIRHLYNNKDQLQLSLPRQSALFFFIRNFAYSGMFRYNAQGNFNVPYGGMAYNRKRFKRKIDYLKTPALQRHLSHTIIENLDFEDFLRKHRPSKDDFLFLDPPYDSEFSTYAQNEFTKDDQIRLAHYLIDGCPAKWMMIIKNTDFIYNLYINKGLRIKSFSKTYLVSFMNRNDKNVEHLLITNY